MTNRRLCAEIDRTLDKSLNDIRNSLSEKERSHLAACPRCRALLRAMDDLHEFPIPSLSLKRVQQALLQDLRPVRPLAPARFFLALLAIIFVALVAIEAYLLGPFGWNVLTVFQKSVILTSLGASAALLGFTMVAQMTPSSTHRIPPPLVPVSAFVLLVIAIAGVFQYGSSPEFVRVGMKCLLSGICCAVPAAIVFFLVLRRGVLLRPLLAGATSGMLAGLIGTSVLEIHCPIHNVWHVLVWHLGVCAVGGLIGLLAGFFSSRAKQSLQLA